tara:strand:- start:58 stop:873 length:816 start_codon:yes stop_codon:yes gene_type:complete
MKKTTLLTTLILLISVVGTAQTTIWESDLSTQANIDSWSYNPVDGWDTDGSGGIFSVGINTIFFNFPSILNNNALLKSPTFDIDAGATLINLEFEGVSLTFGFALNTVEVHIYDTSNNPTGDFSGIKELIGSEELQVLVPNLAEEVTFTIPDSYSGKTVGLIFTTNGTSVAQATALGNFKVSVQLPLSTQNNTIENLSFFPNPVSDIATLQTPANLNTVIVYNQLGQRLLTFNKSELTSKKLDLSSLQTGIYILDVKDVNNNTGKIKVIVE